MTDNTSLAEQLEALAEKATPGPLRMYGEPDVGLRTEPFFGTPMKGGMHPLADWWAYDADLVVALWNNLPTILTALRADQRCAELEAENARLREALAKDATRFEVCAGMIEQSFNASGTLRAERTMKAKHFALEALTALENRDD